MSPDPATFTEWVRARAFPAADPGRPATGGARLIGAEVERLCHLDGGGIAPLESVVLPWVRRLAARQCWRERASPRGAPGFDLPHGGRITFEPGGQIEYAAPPAAGPAPLLADLRRVLALLHESAADAGVVLRPCGIDPEHPLEHAPLQLPTPRYAAMDRYLARRGRFGARMMRQTAAVQVAVDAGQAPLSAWRLLNAVAPMLTALFADSRIYAGRDSGHASFRAACWRRLDPLRTGVFAAEPDEDPAAEYAAFALRAPVIPMEVDARPAPHSPTGENPPAPAHGVRLRHDDRAFGELLRAGLVTEACAQDHLSTLFPEIRPRGYFEVRGMDTVPAAALAAALLPLDALLADATARGEAGEAAGSPDPELLRRAGERGLADAELARRVDALLDVARRAWRRQPERYPGSLVEEAEAWCAARRQAAHLAPPDRNPAHASGEFVSAPPVAAAGRVAAGGDDQRAAC